MKHLKILLALAVILTAFTACRDTNNNGVPDTVPGASAPIISSVPDVLNPNDGDNNNPRSDPDIFEDDNFDVSPGDDYFGTSPGNDDNDTSPGFDVSPGLDQDESVPGELSVPAMSTDFSKIGALDGNLVGWGPGHDKDDKNRPTGAVAFQNKYGQYSADFIGGDNQKVYLTFDEGYENGHTGHILDTLQEKKVSAVFFVTYDYVKAEPDLVRRMIEEGHIIGNHSTAHKSFPSLSLEEAADDIVQLHNYVLNEFGYAMNLFRFPMGEFSEQTLALLQSLGYRSVFWSFAYQDWLVDDQPSPDSALATIVDNCHPGAIYLLHAVSSTNTQILGESIDQIREKGYTFASYDIGKE